MHCHLGMIEAIQLPFHRPEISSHTILDRKVQNNSKNVPRFSYYWREGVQQINISLGSLYSKWPPPESACLEYNVRSFYPLLNPPDIANSRATAKKVQQINK